NDPPKRKPRVKDNTPGLADGSLLMPDYIVPVTSKLATAVQSGVIRISTDFEVARLNGRVNLRFVCDQGEIQIDQSEAQLAHHQWVGLSGGHATALAVRAWLGDMHLQPIVRRFVDNAGGGPSTTVTDLEDVVVRPGSKI